MFNSILVFLHRKASAKLRRAGRISPEKIADEVVTMAMAVCGMISADKNWHQLVNANEKSESDKDFVLNEALSAVLVATYAGLDEMIPDLPGERREFWRAVRDGFYPAFQRWQQANGFPEKAVRDWRELFDLRYAEYQEAQKDTYEKFGVDLASLRSDEDRHASVRIMTIAAMTMAHIARGRRSPTDQEAVRCLQKHLAYTVKALWKRFGW